MWLILSRAPLPDARVWPGRRALALVDALAWPVAWTTVVLGLPVSAGLAGQGLLALCVVAAARRVHRAVMHNYRYHFTTWRWGRWLALVLAYGYTLKLSVMLSA